MAKRILLVDDDEDFITITQSQLQKAGFNVEIAYNGEECIEKVQKEKPDLILLDVVMPGKDGFDVCENLKKDEDTKYIPIILLTAQAKNACNKIYKQHKDSEAEADDYMKKPVDFEKLLKSINELIDVFSNIVNKQVIDSQGIREKILVKGKELNPAFPRERGLIVKATYSPGEFEIHKETPDGTKLLFRPVKPEDEELLREMCDGISEDAIAYKSFQSIKIVPQKVIMQLLKTDYSKDMAICAVPRNTGESKIVGVGFYKLNDENNKADVSFIVRDDWHGKGVSMSIMEILSNIAKIRDVEELRSNVLASKAHKLPLFYNIGYIVSIKPETNGYTVCYEIKRRWSIHRYKDKKDKISFKLEVS